MTRLKRSRALFGLALLLAGLLPAQPLLKQVTVLGGNGNDVVTGMALDSAGNSYIAGYTTSFNLASAGRYRPQRSRSNLYSFDAASGNVLPLFPPAPVQILNLSSDPQLPGTVYAATATQLIKTSDSGATWKTLTVGLPVQLTPYAIAVSPSQSNIVYAGLQSTSLESGVIYGSRDGGATWNATSAIPYSPNPLFGTSITGVSVDPFDPNHLFVYGTETFSTHDGGVSWTATQIPWGLIKVTFDPAGKGQIYGYSFTTPFLTMVKSTDGGQTFVSLPAPALYFIDSIFPDPKRSGTVYLSGSGSSTQSTGIYKSNDAGITWSLVSNIEATGIVEDAKTDALYLMTLQNGIFMTTADFKTVSPILQSVSGSGISSPQSGTLLIATEVKSEGFVSKLDPNGAILFTTYLGGLVGSMGTAVAVDSTGSIYLSAQTSSRDFPQTANLMSSGSTGFYLMKLTADGSMLSFSTAVAPAAGAESMAVDSAGNIYVAGTAGQGYPTTPGAPQPDFSLSGGILPGGPVHTDAFASKFASDGKTLVYSTYFGQGAVDRGHAIVVDTDGSAYIAGTRLWKLNPAGTSLTWSTVLPPGEFRGAALDKQGNLYVCGGTFMGQKLYTTPGAFQAVPGPYTGGIIDSRFNFGTQDAFVAKFSPAGNVIYSTLFGGRSSEAAQSIVVDDQGNATVLGTTQSLDLPMRYPFQAAFNAHTGFLAKFNGDGSRLLYSTFLGDARQFDAPVLARRSDQNLVLAGYTSGSLLNNVILNTIAETATAPSFHVDTILNAANRNGGPIAPGEWVIVQGEGFSSATVMLLSEMPVPITSVTATEILARIPDTAALGPTSLGLASGTQFISSIYVDVAATAPAFFTQDGFGSGQAIALNADGTLNSLTNPASKGGVIRIAVNGIGVVGADTVQAYFQNGVIVPATIESSTMIPGLPGNNYTLLATVIPNIDFFPPGNTIGVALTVDGTTLLGQGFAVTISIQ